MEEKKRRRAGRDDSDLMELRSGVEGAVCLPGAVFGGFPFGPNVARGPGNGAPLPAHLSASSPHRHLIGGAGDVDNTPVVMMAVVTMR
ncbi:hypothetical protein Dda_2271 [Drechslerella dactyloides]|uniref:Uncharacterized protein n=1 Tax=Drechslerella dactyloides TaxID=74499 RepID=A0AAD6J4K6_DREDA|nr:hypothetical protein Dda_2271 [Drechslerella dactyloides]